MNIDLTFKGAAKPATDVKIPMLAHRLNVDEDTVRAVLEVEAGGRSFDSEGRPAMLFEPHVFYRLLTGEQRQRAVEAGLAYPRWGERPYPRESYTRIRAACEINESAALKSASWGSTQILGQNHEIIGYPTVQAMVNSFMDNADAHVEGMVRFILGNGLDSDLRARNWRGFARGYNGPGYERNQYHIKLANAYAKWARIPDIEWSPDEPDPADVGASDREEIARLQRRLAELHYPEVGRADGSWGPRTRAAVLAFRADHSLPIVAAVDDALWAALARSEGRPGAIGGRATETVEDLRERGSETVREADKVDAVGRTLVVGGGVAGINEVLKLFEENSALIQRVTETVGTLTGALGSNWFWIVGAVGLYLVYESGIFRRIRLRDHREMKHVGR